MVQKASCKIQRDTYCNLMSLRGHYSLSIEDTSVMFSAPTSTMVLRNRNRFKSEKKALTDFINEIKDGDIIYDIGANTGLYSLFAASKASDSKVVAFEPYPPNLNLFKQDITGNQLQNIKVIEVALSDSVGTVEFSQPAEDDTGYGSSVIGANGSEATVEVPTTTGDKLIFDGDIPKPDIVKIDVEGAEPLVIDGLEKALSSPNCRTVYCEVHLPGVDRRPSVEDFGSSSAEIQDQLEEFGFTVEEFPNSDRNEVFYKGHK